jgi:pyrroline-5-carboxylate reductase
MNSATKIVLVGCGNMGTALLRGWLAEGIEATQLLVIDASAEALQRVAALGVACRDRLGAEAGPADVVVFAVKPQQLGAMLPDYQPLVAGGAAVLSIAAGKPIGFFEQFFGSAAKIVRAMPNTPAAIGMGITALAAGAAVGADERALCERLMRAVGDVVWLDREAAMDAVTAVSGSGPAYVFLLIEALADAGVSAGLERTLAEQLAKATVTGAAAYAAASAASPTVLREQVTSPGGTTRAALDVLMADDGLAALMARAVEAAAARSRELAS